MFCRCWSMEPFSIWNYRTIEWICFECCTVGLNNSTVHVCTRFEVVRNLRHFRDTAVRDLRSNGFAASCFRICNEAFRKLSLNISVWNRILRNLSSFVCQDLVSWTAHWEEIIDFACISWIGPILLESNIKSRLKHMYIILWRRFSD